MTSLASSSTEDLRSILLTCDGRGKEVKAEALDVLIKRATDEHERVAEHSMGYTDEGFEIIGAYTKLVIGVCCGGRGIQDVLAEEPRASFNRITKEAFASYGENPWTVPGQHSL